MNDLQLMEAEGDVYNALGVTVGHFKQLHEHAHLLNYTSSEDTHVEFRKSFYSLLVKITESNQTLLSLFESLCHAHGAVYQD
jgi:hypothetical protein